MIKCWQIEPHGNSQYDTCVIPVRNEEDNKRALEYAIERLTDAWDQLEMGEKKTVTIELCEMNEEDLPDPEDDA